MSDLETQRKQMVRVLREITIPELKKQGFTGAFPHFRRITTERIDIIAFQFARGYSMLRGAFVVELSVCPLNGFTNHSGKTISPQTVTVYDTLQRDRLTPNPPKDHWFRYANFNWQEKLANHFVKNIYEKRAHEVNELLVKANDFDRLWKYCELK